MYDALYGDDCMQHAADHSRLNVFKGDSLGLLYICRWRGWWHGPCLEICRYKRAY